MNWQNLQSIEDLELALEHLEGAKESFENRDLAFKCIQKAKAFKNVHLEFDARMSYVRQSVFLNQYQEAIGMFPWFLNECDNKENYFKYIQVLWTFKWIINSLTDFHTISLEKIEGLFQEFERRFKEFGTGDRVINYFKAQRESQLGNVERSLELAERYFNDTKTCMLDDCAACQPNNISRVFLVAEQYDRMMECIQPILDGRLTCHVVPHTTFPKAAYASMRTGEWEKAGHYVQSTYKHLDFSTPDLYEASVLLLYHACQKEFLKGRKLMQKQLSFALELNSSGEVYDFYFSCALFMQAYIKAGHKEMKIQVNSKTTDFVTALKENSYDAATLQKWFRETAYKHASLLDNRNRNTFLNDYFEKVEKWFEAFV
ncbi:hypothetical protein [Aureispira sp. CCB-QB1]|uniref:hypothetical protein n=1 Tax=Aureispira sp. CCB-QB1 TaxID=1313421 RepID=UPI0006964717|nr:hypothetical protein [Aureispira sp. CCB-QB1]